MIRRRKWIVILCLVMAVFVAMQLATPSLSNPPVTGRAAFPDDVEMVLRRACYDCHSNETDLKWFDKIAPASWLVSSHIKEGRQSLNFSEWNKLSPAQQKATLFFSLNIILAGEMPLNSYTVVHNDAKISPEDVSVLKNYLIGISPRMLTDTASIQKANSQFESLNEQPALSVKAAPNGIDFLPAYKEWIPVSTTDRFDNGTMRVILGNPVALKAISEGKINPWPDGTVFAKVAWKQLMDSTGMIQPGEFIQVEFMIKDGTKYSTTKGWGWARWKGMDLVPYGKDAVFTAECISCHKPMKENDFVFTMPLHIKPVRP
ncbi:MAG: heme-binding domain-containing protein [Chitinophagaceae bacterium]|nr:heme-binding domain-containing protein [Chitinophagaceae bacterium]